jgi:hypothetical protein
MRKWGAAATVVLLVVVSLAGVLSWGPGSTVAVTSQYGEQVMLWGRGVYAHDSVFKAAGFVGTDLCVLFVMVPMLVVSSWRHRDEDDAITSLRLSSLYGVVLYYAACLCFGVTFNCLMLAYVALLGLSLFSAIGYGSKSTAAVASPSKGLQVFLSLLGIALCVAWLPAIVTATVSGEPLPTIEVYTTEVSYVLDIGIISPMCFVSLWLMRRGSLAGTTMAAFLLTICALVGAMVIAQTVCQMAAGLEVPILALVSQVAIFTVLGGAAIRLKKGLMATVSVSASMSCTTSGSASSPSGR